MKNANNDSSDFDGRYRTALSVIGECSYDDLCVLKTMIDNRINKIKRERSLQKKIEVLECGVYSGSTFMPIKAFHVKDAVKAKECIKFLIDKDTGNTVKVGIKSVLVYPDELKPLGLS